MNFVSVPVAAFILLLGLLWSPKPVLPPAEEDEEALTAHRQALRRQARNGVLRGLMLVGGSLLLLLKLLGGLGKLTSGENFALLVGIYGGLFLLAQRSEINRRLATLVILSPLTLLIVPRFAAYEGHAAESNWAVYAALLANYLFWLTIGRRFPVGSSEEIKVWGMDEGV